VGSSAASAGCCCAAGRLDGEERQTLRDLFALNRRLAKAYLLKEQLAQLWTYTYEGATHRFLTNWLLALRWQRLPAVQKLGAPADAPSVRQS
jgi:transposase